MDDFGVWQETFPILHIALADCAYGLGLIETALHPFASKALDEVVEASHGELVKHGQATIVVVCDMVEANDLHTLLQTGVGEQLARPKSFEENGGVVLT